jgi:histidinol-phosphate aminotransferase
MNSKNRIDRWVRPAVRALSAYHVPESAGYVKLDAMENPYSWPEELVAPWLDALKGVHLNRYPDAEAAALKSRLRTHLELPSGVELVLGNGSDELIQMLCLALAGPSRVLLAPEPTFAMYRIIAGITGLEYVGVPLRSDDFSLDVEAMLQAIEAHEPALVALCYPNNPTGNLFDRAALEAIIEASPGVVLIDEAYFHFAHETFLGTLSKYEHVLVLRTLSKLGLAGLRVGMLIGSPAWLHEINKLRLPYNLNTLSQKSCEFMLGHAEVLSAQAERVRAGRESLYRELKAMPGLEVWPSQTNFLLMRVGDKAQRLFDGLKHHKILVKNLDGAHPLLSGCLRITIGTPEENRSFVTALQKLL